MNKVQQIKDEVERLKNELITNCENTMFEQGRISAFEDMVLFINSLQEKPFDYCNATIVQKDFAEPVIDNIEEASDKYARQFSCWLYKSMSECFKAGAEWQKQQISQT